MIHSVVDNYILLHDLAHETAAWYRRIASVYSNWDKSAEFTADGVSRLLHDKQQEGRSSHYRKSLRNGYRALLNFAGDRAPIRAVRLDPIEPEAWSESEVARLIAAVPGVIDGERLRWLYSRTIAVAFYTGLSQVDLFRLTADCIDARGILRTRRQKTGTRVVAWLPKDLADELRACTPGPIFPLGMTKEWFRVRFNAIVKAAGLSGSFKKLRSTSGTVAEDRNPGRGHIHLANSRTIFERHYWRKDEDRPARMPTLPPRLG